MYIQNIFIAVRLRGIIISHRKKMNKRVLRDSFKAWSQMVIDKKKIMATWKTKGLFLMRKQLSGRVRTPFSILCYYAYCRSYLRKVYLYQYYYFYFKKNKI